MLNLLDTDNPALRRRLDKAVYIFDDKNEQFVPNDELNKFYLAHTQNYLTNKLRAQGYLFLNDVLKQIGIAPTMIGQLAGWRASTGQGFVKIKIEQTMIGTDGRPKEYFLRIEHDGLIIDELGD